MADLKLYKVRVEIKDTIYVLSEDPPDTDDISNIALMDVEFNEQLMHYGTVVVSSEIAKTCESPMSYPWISSTVESEEPIPEMSCGAWLKKQVEECN